MRDGRTIPNEPDPWSSGPTIHVAPILDDTTFDPEKATLMFLPSRSLIESLERAKKPPASGTAARLKSLLLLLAMLLILALEIARV
jgi:hypothetical protein